MTRLRVSDERGVIGVSLIRWTVILLLLGLILVEGGSIIFTTIGLQNAADAAAVEAADVWGDTLDLGAAQVAARSALDNREREEARILLKTFEADRVDPYEVRFTVVEQAATMLVHRIGFLEDFARVEVEVNARPVEPGI